MALTLVTKRNGVTCTPSIPGDFREICLGRPLAHFVAVVRPGMANYNRSGLLMRFDDLFAAIDAKPFRPFKIELVSGTKITVSHPDKIMVLPTRQRVHHIEVYQDL